MKIKKVKANNRKHAFDVTVKDGRTYVFPYSQLTVKPTGANRISAVEIDKELGGEGFTYQLESGESDTVHIDHVRHYAAEPVYVLEQVRHRMSLAAKEQVKKKVRAKREIIRRLSTSPSQLERLIDPANSKSTIDGLLKLLVACEIDVDFLVDGKSILKGSHDKEPAS